MLCAGSGLVASVCRAGHDSPVAPSAIVGSGGIPMLGALWHTLNEPDPAGPSRDFLRHIVERAPVIGSPPDHAEAPA